MKKTILKGNMPQWGCFYSLCYEDGNIVFSTVDNSKRVPVKINEYLLGEEHLSEASKTVIIKSEDELIEKLLTTKYHDDVDEIEHITERFNKCSSYFLEALGVSGTDISIHYKNRCDK
jgi:hypothetical protein